MPEKTPLRSIPNALAFELKRPCVWSETPLCFKSNALAFFLKAEYVLENPFVSVRTIPFSLRAYAYAHMRII